MKFYWCSYEVNYPEGVDTKDTSFFKTKDETRTWFRDFKKEASTEFKLVAWRDYNYPTPKGWIAEVVTSGEVTLYCFEVEI